MSSWVGGEEGKLSFIPSALCFVGVLFASILEP